MNNDSKFQQSVEAFTKLFEPLVDPDPGTTVANLVPILGNHVNTGLLGVLGTFLSDWFFESVEVTQESYVVLKGRRLPLSCFTGLDQLVRETPPGVLSVLIEGLASLPADLSFPDSFVSGDYENSVSDRTSLAKEVLYKAVTNGLTVEDAMRSGAYQARISESGT